MSKPVSCGTCSLCCKLKRIDAPSLQKPQGEWCSHCAPGKGGCQIYHMRPEPCQDYWCIWLDSQTRDSPMPINLRPDKLKIVMDITEDQKTLVLWVDPQFRGAERNKKVEAFLLRIKRSLNVIVATGTERYVLSVTKEGEGKMADLEKFQA